MVFGPSPVFHARAYTHAAKSSSASVNSRSPPSALISSRCSSGVVRRSVYRATHAGSAIRSCPARCSVTSCGTSSGSVRNVPR